VCAVENQRSPVAPFPGFFQEKKREGKEGKKKQSGSLRHVKVEGGGKKDHDMSPRGEKNEPKRYTRVVQRNEMSSRKVLASTFSVKGGM
jgi:hypothetical protein